MPKTINYFQCLRCNRAHYDGELLFDFHVRYAFRDEMKEIEPKDKPPVSHCLWIQNIYDTDKADTSRVVTLNIVQANEAGYSPIEKLTMTLKEAREYRDNYHRKLDLSDAEVEAIIASSMFFENGVRFPDNLAHYM